MDKKFQSTLPAGEATMYLPGVCRRGSHFNPRFPRGKRPSRKPNGKKDMTISIHASRGGSDFKILVSAPAAEISIHASRGGSDMPASTVIIAMGNFNPRFPRGKRRCVRFSFWMSLLFQSTLPAGEATGLTQTSIHWSKFQSTLPAGEATPHPLQQASHCQISIHASRGGSDPGSLFCFTGHFSFQSTLPAGEATYQSVHSRQRGKISIHASRGGSDDDGRFFFTHDDTFQSTLPAGEATCGHLGPILNVSDFNPRFPRGKRQSELMNLLTEQQFQSTLPAGEATVLPTFFL